MEKISLKKESESALNKNFQSQKMNVELQNLIKKTGLNEDEAKRNLSSLLDTLNELNNCKNCKGLHTCPNHAKGYVYYPKKDESYVSFNYIPCKKLKEFNQNIVAKEESYEINHARMKDIDLTDKKRVDIIKWLTNFYKKYNSGKENKGLYLHGSFGSGKTFLLAALLNELKENYHVNYELVYFPELLRDLKDDFSFLDNKIHYLSNVEILVLDDIGAEKVTSWARDEILGPILQYRMNNHLTTFFTSNLSIEELEKHLAISSDSIDVVKSRRIIERIKQLTVDMPLISVNRRH